MQLSLKIIAITLLVYSSGLWAHSGATGIVKERMDNFKESKASMKLLKKAVRNKDFDTIVEEAESIHRWAAKLTTYFPEGSNPHPSEALDLIWKELDRFELRAVDQLEASGRLRKAGVAKDANGAATAFSELGQSCKACHDDYRE
ncbi:MAG: c-type cytochrome [Neptuniibacter sp.]